MRAVSGCWWFLLLKWGIAGLKPRSLSLQSHRAHPRWPAFAYRLRWLPKKMRGTVSRPQDMLAAWRVHWHHTHTSRADLESLWASVPDCMVLVLVFHSAYICLPSSDNLWGPKDRDHTPSVSCPKVPFTVLNPQAIQSVTVDWLSALTICSTSLSLGILIFFQFFKSLSLFSRFLFCIPPEQFKFHIALQARMAPCWSPFLPSSAGNNLSENTVQEFPTLLFLAHWTAP